MKDKPKKDELKSCRYYIDGMHCAACEVLIERKLADQKGVYSVDASLAKGKVDVVYEGKRPDIEELNRIFEKDNYTFSEKKLEKENSPMLMFKDGDIYFDKSKVKRSLGILAALIILIGLFFVLEKSGLSGLISVSSNSSLPVFFVFGLLAGVSSCAALVGGILLSLSKQWNDLYITEGSNLKKSQPFIMFNAGRLLSFLILGGILGSIGSFLGLTFNVNSSFTSILVIGVSIMMIILGMQMVGFKWADKFQLHMPKFIGKRAAQDNLKGKYMPFISGVLTFFVPCGFTLVAQGIALTSGSFISGSLIMLFFALGTLPMLAIISISSLKLGSNTRLRLSFNKIAGLLVLFFAIYNLNAQLNVMGVWSLSNINFDFLTISQSPIEVTSAPMILETSGEQKIQIVAKGFEYKLIGSTKLLAGKKTILEVDNQGISGCGAYLAARGLIDNYIKLSPGKNIVEFTPQRGTYKITCSMGMVAPVIITVV